MTGNEWSAAFNMDTLRFSTASKIGNTFAYGGSEAAWWSEQVHGMWS
jgi:hypothetical protein